MKQIASETVKIVSESGYSGMSDLVIRSFPEQLIDILSKGDIISDMELLRDAFSFSRTLFSTLLEKYFYERRRYGEFVKLQKLPQFEVLELLADDEIGLYGFKIHFSNGSSARFIRGGTSTECVNISLNVPLEFMIGAIDELKDEWRIGEKRLYEVGLPGRYNALGEWKPIIYPGDSEVLQREALSMSEDRDVSGSIFYMMCTGHRAIEFVVRTSIEMPVETFTFGKNLHFFRCPAHDDIPNTYPNFQIYDGWLELESADPEVIRSWIAGIGVAVNRMAFAYDERVDWRLKYKMTMNPGNCPTPSREDLQVLDRMLREFPRTKDAIILDAAIDWYHRGMSSRSVFESFLCYYVAVESVSLAVANGYADLGLDYPRETKEERRQRTVKCIQEKHKSFKDDPAKFVRDAYLDCIYGITEKVRRLTEIVFGSEHDYLKALFEERDGNSLSGIRSKIAHGEFTLISRDDEALVRNRLPEMAGICKEFLLRVAFLLKPSESFPPWSRRFSVHVGFSDPRNTLVVSRESVLPTKDWRIRAEWCD